jgi:tRNA(His) 5'-end guanylyltransferase
MRIFKELEDSYNISLPDKSTIVIRADGKNFSKLLKPFGVTDLDHADSMLDAAIETIKLTQNFVLAFVQSDEISIILSNEDSEKSQPWFGNRIQKITTITSSSMSVHYSGSMSYYKSKQIVGLFDARTFNIERKDVINYLRFRIKNGYSNTISKVYRFEMGKTDNKTLDTMEYELIENGFFIDSLYKFGTVIIKGDSGFDKIPVENVLSNLEEFVNHIFLSIEKRKADG